MLKLFQSMSQCINVRLLSLLILTFGTVSSAHAQPAEPPQGGLRAYFSAYGVPGRLQP